MKKQTQLLCAIGVVLCVGVGIFLIKRNSSSQSNVADKPTGSIYYTGPMRGKSGVMANDSWANP